MLAIIHLVSQPFRKLHAILTWTVGTFIWGIIQINVELVVAGLTASAEIFVSDYETGENLN